MNGESTELDALAGEAAAVDLQVAPVASPDAVIVTEQAALPVVDRNAEAVMLVGMLRPMAGMMSPALKDAPDSEWQALHEPMAELLAFYNVDVTKYLASPWAKLAFCSLPLVLRVWQAEADPEKPDLAKPENPDPGKPDPVFVERA